MRLRRVKQDDVERIAHNAARYVVESLFFEEPETGLWLARYGGEPTHHTILATIEDAVWAARVVEE